MPNENHVLVVGPHGRHFEVHKTTQQAMPKRFPLVETKKTAVAANDKKES